MTSCWWQLVRSNTTRRGTTATLCSGFVVRGCRGGTKSISSSLWTVSAHHHAGPRRSLTSSSSFLHRQRVAMQQELSMMKSFSLSSQRRRTFFSSSNLCSLSSSFSSWFSSAVASTTTSHEATGDDASSATSSSSTTIGATKVSSSSGGGRFFYTPTQREVMDKCQELHASIMPLNEKVSSFVMFFGFILGEEDAVQIQVLNQNYSFLSPSDGILGCCLFITIILSASRSACTGIGSRYGIAFRLFGW